MKKNPFQKRKIPFFAFLLFITTGAFFAFRPPELPPEVQLAKTWYQTNNSGIKHLGVTLLPNWQEAVVWMPDTSHIVVDAPLFNTDSFQYRIKELTTGILGDSTTYNGSTRVVLFKEKNDLNFRMYMLKIVGSSACLNQFGNGFIKSVRSNAIPVNFSGAMIYSNVAYSNLEGRYYLNGVASAVIKPDTAQFRGDGVQSRWQEESELYQLIKRINEIINSGGHRPVISGITYTGGNLNTGNGSGGDGNTYDPTTQKPLDEGEEGPNGPCKLTNIWEVRNGPTVRCNEGFIGEAQTSVSAKLIDCKKGYIKATSNISSSSTSGKITFSNNLVTGRSHIKATKQWIVTTQNAITIEFRYMIFGLETICSASSENQITFVLDYN